MWEYSRSPASSRRQHNVAVVQGFASQKLGIDFSNPSVVYSANDFIGVFKSTDAGLNWTRVFAANQSMGALATDPTNSQIIYIAPSAELRKSTDGGLMWSTIDSLGSTNSLAIDPTNPNKLYSGVVIGVA